MRAIIVGLNFLGITSDATTPTRPLTGFSVQTAIPGQVYLINTSGLSLNFGTAIWAEE